MALAVEQVTSGEDTTASFTYTFGSSTTAGNLLVILVFLTSSSATLTSVSDSAGNTWTVRGTKQNTGSGAATVFVADCVNGSSGAHTVTLAFSPTDPGFVSAHLCEISGQDASPFDATEDAEADSVTSLNTGPLTPAQADSILLSIVATTGDRTFSIPADWTAVGTQQRRSHAAYRIVDSVAAYDSTYSWSGGLGDAIGVTIAYKAGAEGGGNVTLTADPASWTFTGSAASLKVSRKLVANAASISYTSSAANLRVSRKLVASPASWSFTGNDATLTVTGTETLTADPFAVTFTGASANLRVSRKLIAAPASFSWTGASATLKVSRKLVADAFSVVWTGLAATFTSSGDFQKVITRTANILREWDGEADITRTFSKTSRIRRNQTYDSEL